MATTQVDYENKYVNKKYDGASKEINIGTPLQLLEE
jgi:hypothetical protein